MRERAIGLALALLVATAAGAQQASQKNTQAGVTVAVTPQDIGAGAKEWAFKVVFDTHSQELSDDVLKSSILIDGQGRESKPLAWEGAAPGGHHREGVLKFAAMEPFPDAVELRIARPGESAPRAFLWQLK